MTDYGFQPFGPPPRSTRVPQPMIQKSFVRVASQAGLLMCLAATAADAQGAQTTEAPGAAASAARAAVALRVDMPPVVDGRLDEEVWQSAPVLGGFVQRIPRDGAPASEETEVRVLFDAQAIYVGVWLRDSNPDGIVPGEAIRDSQLDESDAVVLIFDTYLDRQNGFVFGTNPAGIEFDGQVANQGQGGGFGGGLGGRQQGGAGGGFNLNWDGSWTVATSRDARGWYAEFRIPFSTLRYGPADVQTWGFNVMRRIRRHNEESFWAPVPRQFSLFRLSAAGTLAGLEPPFRRAFSLTPYVLGSARRDYQAGDAAFRHPAEAGGDAKLQLTQGLTLDLTLNTDFAQVEVDDQQVNLSRFSLFFPEKRPFFLENAGFFNVSGGGNELFFSRRVGIVGGQQVPIQGGGRLSGRTMGMNVGMLHIRTGAEGGGLASAVVPEEAFSVVRLARELPNRSRVGAFFGDRTGLGLGGNTNRTYAVDGQVGIGQGLNLNSFLARTETPGRSGRDHAFHLSGSYADREWQGSVSYREMGADFNPGIGFVPRTNYRTYSGFLMHYIRPEGSRLLREVRPHAFYNTFRNLETGFEQSARLHLDVHFEAPNGAFFSPAFDWVREGLERPFPIASDVVVAPGTYEGWTAAWRFNTNRSALLAFDGGLDVGSFLSGNRRGVHGTITARPGSSLLVSLRSDYNDVRLAEGDFTATLIAARVGYFFTPRIYAQSLVQYSDQLDTWSANVRFGWLGTAGTGLFVVYNDARGIDDLSGPLNRSLIVKFSRQFDLR
jgi:hypothetical protein